MRKVPVLAPAQLANLPARTVVVYRRGISPVIGRARMAWTRPDVRAVQRGLDPATRRDLRAHVVDVLRWAEAWGDVAFRGIRRRRGTGRARQGWIALRGWSGWSGWSGWIGWPGWRARYWRAGRPERPDARAPRPGRTGAEPLVIDVEPAIDPVLGDPPARRSDESPTKPDDAPRDEPPDGRPMR